MKKLGFKLPYFGSRLLYLALGLVVAALLIVIFSPRAEAAHNIACMTEEKLEKTAREKHGELPLWESADGDRKHVRVVLYMGESGSWTLAFVKKDGTACLVAGGKASVVFPERDLPDEPLPKGGSGPLKPT